MIKNLIKRCTKCEKTRLRSLFHNNSEAKDGKQYHCKLCMKKYAQENKERLSAYAKWWLSNNKEKFNKINRESYHRNKKSINEIRRLKYKLNTNNGE